MMSVRKRKTHIIKSFFTYVTVTYLVSTRDDGSLGCAEVLVLLESRAIGVEDHLQIGEEDECIEPGA